MTAGAAFRGQPLLMLIGLLLGWLVLRTVVWPRPFIQLPGTVSAALTPVRQAAVLADVYAAGSDSAQTATRSIRISILVAGSAAPAALLLPNMPATYRSERIAPMRPEPRDTGMSHTVRSPAAEPLLIVDDPFPYRGKESRWRADGWLLLRRDSTRAVAGAGTPAYGRSQLGGVLRYNLVPESGLRPQAYVRISSALSGPADPELAAGFSARPIGTVPLRFAAEVRGSEIGVRPAIHAVTELPAFELPFGARAEVYAQAGYVAGSLATGFADGQARIERPVARVGPSSLSAGAGVWGGAQKGAARLDAGPTLALRFPIGEAHGRLAADYRFRIAGGAMPGNGPALTLSAGF